MKVTKDRIYEQDLFEPLKKMARESTIDLGKMEAQTKLLSKSLVDLSKNYDGTAKSQRALIEADNASKKAMQDKIALDEKQIKLKTANERLTQAELRTKKMLEDQDKRNAKAQKDLNSEYSKQSKRLNDLRKEYKDLILVQGKETEQTRKLKKEIISLDATLKKVDATVGQHQRSVGNYQKALGGLRNALTQLGVGFGVFQILRDSFNIITEHEDAMASLSAITGLTGEKFEVFKVAINDVATELNVSGTEVTQAAEKIASAQPALLDNADALAAVTKEAITLNRAIKGDLTETSLALVGVMNQFGLEASEAADVINILAAGSQAGAASVNQINESIVKFGTTADLMNITVEESVGLIETLGEKAIFGADAGTALRNILLKMSSIDVLPKKALDQLEKYGVNTDIVKDKSLSFEERLRELSKVAKDSTAIMQIFGTENATAATVLLNNLDTYSKMTDAVTGTSVATEQAAINQNTLSAVIGELRAAWENLVVEFSEGENVLVGLKAVLRFIADNLKTIVTIVIKSVVAWGSYRLALKLWNKEGTGVVNVLVNWIKLIPAASKGVGGLKGAMSGLGAAMKAIPFAGWIAALVTLGPMIWDFAKGVFEGSKQTSALDKVTEKLNDRMTEEKAKMSLVFKELERTNAGSERRAELIEQINSTYGTTLRNLSDETEFANQLAAAYEEVNKQLERKIRAELIKDEITVLIEQQIQLERQIEAQEAEVERLNVKKSTSFSSSIGGTQDIMAAGAQGKLNGLNRELDDLNMKIDELFGELNPGNVGKSLSRGITPKMRDFATATSDVKNEIKDLRTELEKSGVELISFEEKLRRLGVGGKIKTRFDVEEPTDFFGMTADQLTKYGEAQKKILDDLEQMERESMERRKEMFKEINEFITDMINANSSKIDQQIARQQMMFDGARDREAELRRIAEERGLNATESIEAEREAQKKALVEIERLEGKKRELEMTIAAMKLLADGKSVADIKASILDIKSFVKASAEGSFYDGTDTTVGAALGYNNVRDGHNVNVDDNEAIFNPAQTAALNIRPGGNTTQDVVDAFKRVHQLADAKISAGISGSGSFAENIYSSAILNQLVQMKDELKALPENMPQTDLGFNAYVGSFEFERRTKLRREKVRYNVRRK